MSTPRTDRTEENRSSLLDDAVAFLRDPKVASSPLTQKIQFLESKGLTENEIQQALIRVSSPDTMTPPPTSSSDINFPDPAAIASPSSSSVAGSEPRVAPPALPARNHIPPNYHTQPYAGYQTAMAQPWPTTEPPQRDWRDVFVMAVISGGVAYGLTALARKYLLPHLRPPTTTSFEQTSAELAEQFDEASKILAELQTKTSEIHSAVETQREKVDAAVEDVNETVQRVKDGEQRWREEMRELREELQELRELVPKMIEKHAREQGSSLGDLQSELKSLRTLMMARRATPQTGIAANSASAPSDAPVSGAAVTSNGQSDVATAANALLAPRSGTGSPFPGKPTVPAWQLASSSSGETSS